MPWPGAGDAPGRSRGAQGETERGAGRVAVRQGPGGRRVDEPALSVLTVAGGPVSLHQTSRSLVDQEDRRWQWCLTGLGDQDAHDRVGIPLDPRVTSVPGDVADGW